MFTNKDKQNYDHIMESIESMGEGIGMKVHKGGSKVIKYIVMGSLVVLIGGLIFISSLIKRSIGSKS